MSAVSAAEAAASKEGAMEVPTTESEDKGKPTKLKNIKGALPRLPLVALEGNLASGKGVLLNYLDQYTEVPVLKNRSPRVSELLNYVKKDSDNGLDILLLAE